MSDGLPAQVREVLKQHAKLAVDVDALSPIDDLFQAGMSSHASVNVMLALEDRFGIEFPDAMLRRDVFMSIASIGGAVAELREE